MLNRLTAAFVLTCAIPLAAAAQQTPYPAGAYAQQQPGYPQQYPQPQAQPQYPYPPPDAAMQPGYGPPSPLAYGDQYGEPLVSSVKGALQLSLGTYFVRYTSLSQSFDENAGDFSRTDLAWGFSASSPVIVEGGYGITDSLVVGGVLQLGGWSQTFEAEMGGAKAERSTFDLLLAPKVDYHFIPTSKINPFVGGMLGVEINSASTPSAMAGMSDEESSTSFTLLARGGLRCWLFDGFSVDPALSVGFKIGGGSTKPAGGSELDWSASGFRVGLSVSMSGWLRI
jgi:hypothetical protein